MVDTWVVDSKIKVKILSIIGEYCVGVREESNI